MRQHYYDSSKIYDFVIWLHPEIGGFSEKITLKGPTFQKETGP
jgi:hypothetical protein